MLREQLVKSEARAERAEAALIAEREARMRDVRHVLSAWLRHERAPSLPPTAGEKAESQATAEEARKNPVLTEVQISMRDAIRKEAIGLGYTKEDADDRFMRNLESLSMD